MISKILPVKKKKKILFLFIILLTIIIFLPFKNYYFPEKKTIFRLGIDYWIGYQMALYSVEKGIFLKHGLNVELLEFDSLQDAGRAMIRGALDATFTTMWEIMQTDTRDDSPVVLMAVSVSNGADGVVTNKLIKSVPELIDKKIGAKFGSVAHLILLEALESYKIPPSKVNIVNLSYESALEKMYEKKIDGLVIYEPFLSEIVKKVLINIIYTTKNLGTAGVDILASRSQFVANHQQELSKFILGWFELMEALDNKPDEVLSLVSKEIGTTKESLARSFAGLKKGDIPMNQEMLVSGQKLLNYLNKI